jgi:NADP-dependent 3-hydroxy acid dehydrogenase YdfG
MTEDTGVLIVTGAGSGMGAAAVRLALGRYPTVCALDRDPAALERLIPALPSSDTAVFNVDQYCGRDPGIHRLP